MSTIPPYLYAAYSIKDQESEACRLIVSVVVEEMLHLALTTNLLLALGGEPDFGEGLVPGYPGLLAHHQPDLRLELQRCTPEVVRNTFMAIERPETHGAGPQADAYETLGQFYLALEEALHRLSAATDLFTDHQPDRQLSDPSLYGPVVFDAAGSGGLLLIHDLDTARRALEIIIDQGEGLGEDKWADPEHQELTHYFKFAQLAEGEIPIGETWPVMNTPHAVDLAPAIRPVADLFNAVYRLLFITMKEMFAAGSDQGGAAGRLYRLMSKCLAPIARHLVTLPIDGEHTAGPTFEFYRFRGDPSAEALSLAGTVIEADPVLAPVAEALRSAVGR
jgi:hypothetical protein